MIWFLLYVVLSFPAVWVIGKLEPPPESDPTWRFITAMIWPMYFFLTLVCQIGPTWNSIYLFIFPGDKENEKD